MRTPGTWIVSPPSGTGLPDSAKQYNGKPYCEHSSIHAQQGDTLKSVAHVYQGYGEIGSPQALAEQYANCRLIAAAPALYDAASACIPDLQHYVDTHGPGPDRRLSALLTALAMASDDPAAIEQRACNSCDWTGPLTATAQSQHVPSQILCPACNDTTEPK